MIGRRSGFSLIEVLIAALFLASVLAGMLVINTQSNRSSMDAYYEMIGWQLALEPIEVFRALGYIRMKTYHQKPLTDFPLGECDLGTLAQDHDIDRPTDCTLFKRNIDLENVERGDVHGILVKVKVYPKEQSSIKTWLSKDVITVTGLIVEEPR